MNFNINDQLVKEKAKFQEDDNFNFEAELKSFATNKEVCFKIILNTIWQSLNVISFWPQ